mmetsp:Transcript_31669/g.49577  ORF Transcript_31669/g.49577 Transcript_31669/m.49577 type:complete len:86 (-) Transcript_31669:14-271(-)
MVVQRTVKARGPRIRWRYSWLERYDIFRLAEILLKVGGCVLVRAGIRRAQTRVGLLQGSHSIQDLKHEVLRALKFSSGCQSCHCP